MKQLTVKGYGFKADDAGTVEAYVAVFGNVDSYNERIKLGAFGESIKSRLPKIVWSHDFNRPVGKTLTIEEVPAGDHRLPDELKDYGALYVKGAFALKTRDGMDMYEHLKFGSIDEFSIGYEVKNSTAAVDGVTELTEITLYEWSPVLVGANPLTSLVNVKTMTKSEMATLADAVANAILENAEAHADMREKIGRTVSGASHNFLSDVADRFDKASKDLRKFLKDYDPTASATEPKSVRVMHLKQQLMQTRI